MASTKATRRLLMRLARYDPAGVSLMSFFHSRSNISGVNITGSSTAFLATVGAVALSDDKETRLMRAGEVGEAIGAALTDAGAATGDAGAAGVTFCPAPSAAMGRIGVRRAATPSAVLAAAVSSAGAAAVMFCAEGWG